MNAELDFEENTQSLDDYVKIFKRRKKQFFIPAAIVLFLSLLAALLWPTSYESTATILIEEQQIPIDLVPSTVTSYAAQQIEVIKARTLTMKNIMDMIQKYQLYSESELKLTARSRIMEEFIENLRLDVLSAGVIDPKTGRPSEATIAFSLAFTNSDPVKAQQIANELVNLYLNENLRDRTEKSSSTSLFLKEEAKALSDQLQKLEADLAQFKEEHEGSLPELRQYNLNIMDRTERELLDASLRIKELEKRKLSLESQIAQVSPYAPVVLPSGEQVLSDQDRLKSLRSEYRQKAAVYNLEHPDVVRLKREINVLEKELGTGLTMEEYEEQLRAEEATLADLTKKYTPDHPQVLAQKRVLELLVADRPEKVTAVKSANPDADSPTYVLLDTQIQSTIIELQILKENKLELEKKLKRYEDSILKAPMVEKEYIAMYRDYENTTMKYGEIKSKLMAAELAQSLETDRKGQRFTLIDPPLLPEEPVSPNRTAILFLGFILAIASGVAVVILLEAISPAIRGSKSLSEIVGAAPLAVIPYIRIEEEMAQSSNRIYYIGGAILAAIIIFLLSVHLAYKPLDVIFFVLLRKLGLN